MKRVLEFFQLVVLIAMLGLIVYGIVLGTQIQRDSTQRLNDIETVINSRGACVVPLQDVIKEATESGK